MKRVIISGVALALALTLAFGSMGSSDDKSAFAPSMDHEPAVSLTAPWSDMNLPLGPAKITSSDDSSLNLEYPAHSPVAPLKTGYVAALMAAGWTIQEDDDGSDPDHVNVELKKGESSIDMTIMSIGDVSVDVDFSYSE